MKSLQMGIYDNLDTQTQPLLNIDIITSNVLVFGGHMSGKTTFLKTLLIRMHQNIEQFDSEEIYVIDFGGNLGDYKNLPLISACFDSSNEENVRRIFRTVESKLEQNIKQLSSKQFCDAYKETAGQKPLHITLIIDNINSFLSDERYNPYLELLIKFSRDGLSKGLSIVFTANDTSNSLSKFLSYFSHKLVFDVPTDVYIDIFGAKVNEPIKTSGRGLISIEGKSREFQAFLPFEDESNELPAFATSLWNIPFTSTKLKAFGEELTYNNFSEYSENHISIENAENDIDEIAVGLDYYDHKPIMINLAEMHSIAIYGKKKFGKSNLLQLIVSGIRRKHPNYAIVFVDDGRKQLENLHIDGNPYSIYLNKIEQLTEFLDYNGYYAKPGNRTFEEKETFPTVFVLQNKMLYQSSGKNLLSTFSKMSANAEEKKYYFIYSDIKKIGNGDREAESYLNNSFSVAFLLDNIAEFVSDKGSRSVFGEMDAKELKNEYARCELGDGYFYDIESDELAKVKFLKA